MGMAKPVVARGSLQHFARLVDGSVYDTIGRRILRREMLSTVKMDDFRLLKYAMERHDMQAVLEPIIKDVLRNAANYFERSNLGQSYNKLVHLVHENSVLLQAIAPKKDIVYFAHPTDATKSGITLTFNRGTGNMTSYSQHLGRKRGLADSYVDLKDMEPKAHGEVSTVRGILNDMAQQKTLPRMKAVIDSRNIPARLAELAGKELSLGGLLL